MPADSSTIIILHQPQPNFNRPNTLGKLLAISKQTEGNNEEVKDWIFWDK